MEKQDTISRKYAINQIDIAILKEESKEERERLCLIKEFLLALPSVELEQKVNEQLKWERDTAIEQLRSYGIDFGEKANVIKLPCKVGDMVYRIAKDGKTITKERVGAIHVEYTIDNGTGIGDVWWLKDYNIGVTTFLTREEAEAVLKAKLDEKNHFADADKMAEKEREQQCQ